MQHYLRKQNLTLLILLVLFTAMAPSHAKGKSDQAHYRLLFEVDLTRTDGFAHARLSVEQSADLLREVRLRAAPDQYTDFSGDGTIHRDGPIVVWRPPEHGGSLNYTVLIDHQRSKGGFDALVTDDWALFRGDDIVPPASISQRTGAQASSKFSARLPGDWTIATPFAEGPDGQWLIDNPARNFDRPVGWIIAGRLGVRRDIIAGIEVSVAGPIGVGIQRIGMLALLRWTVPLLAAEMTSVPPRISIVSAGAPMWRGGLSAPNSLYIHADRPILSENATSTLLHETIHVLIPIPTADAHDWIDEGIAEYVTLEILRRSGTISAERFDTTIAKFNRRGQNIDNLSTTHASGAVTAKAVVIFHNVDIELQTLTDGQIDIFDLIRRLMSSNKPVELADLRRLTTELTGGKPLAALEM